MDQPSPDDLRRAVAAASEAMVPHAGLDWSQRAGDLEWTCRMTLNHTIDALLWYAANLAMLSPTDRPDLRDCDPGAPIGDLVDTLVSAGHILARVAEATPQGGRGYHSWGRSADASGFLAMGCDEVLVHGRDICMGLGAPFRPPDDISARVVARLFPWAPEHDDSWERLLWCNGRLALPGHDRLGPGWGWWAAPVEEWDGVAYTDRRPHRSRAAT